MMWENENMKVWAFENVMMLSWDCHEQTGWNSCEKLSCSSSNGTVPPPFFFLETQPLLIHKTERGLYQKLSDTILIKASQQKCFSKNYVYICNGGYFGDSDDDEDDVMCRCFDTWPYFSALNHPESHQTPLLRGFQCGRRWWWWSWHLYYVSFWAADDEWLWWWSGWWWW